ncbi:MAG: hypothetical protein OXU66_05100 [Gammaproteobacteria bacterium]|nr:hypothetical protein [Gammaproteobacteria bacterium]MDD9896445.1 hypothetical protein [Gammaproteobacteria bacterium]MDD9958299.1 hypothetical protein [Gammaproteobacteria bacterium]
MGQVVKLSDFCRARAAPVEPAGNDRLVPIELASGIMGRAESLAKITEYGLRVVHVHQSNDDPNKFTCLMSVSDAIWMNKNILEQEPASDQEIADRIGLIQLLENMDFSMTENLWESFARQGKFSQT